MARYRVGVPGGNGFATNGAMAVLWNPSSTIAIGVVRVYVAHNSTVTAPSIARATTRGTASATTTPDADNHHSGRAAPPSGTVLDRGTYTVEPTRATPNLYGFQLTNTNGSAVDLWLPEPIVVPPGEGLGLWGTTTATAYTYAFEWEE
jgi:hypothetical protein